MTRKMLSIVLAVIVSVTSLLSGNILAAYIPPDTPQNSYTSSCSSTLTISGTTATCTSSVTGYDATTKIVITQTLQKQNSSGIWTDVSGATWSSTINDCLGWSTNTKSGLSSGTYRLKSAFKVYVGNSYEPIVKYSQSKTI